MSKCRLRQAIGHYFFYLEYRYTPQELSDFLKQDNIINIILHDAIIGFKGFSHPEKEKKIIYMIEKLIKKHTI